MAGSDDSKKRKYVSQSDVPRHSLEEALKIPRVIFENYALDPTRPLDVAAALELQPQASYFRTLTGAAAAYGVTDGGAAAPKISVTELGKRIVAPQEDGDDRIAKIQAMLAPRIASEFLRKYDSKPLPRDDIARNVLLSMGVPKDSLERVFTILIDNAKNVGVLRPIKGTTYVDLSGAGPLEISTNSGSIVVEESPSKIIEEPAKNSAPVLLPKQSSGTLVRVGDIPTSFNSQLRRGLQIDAYILRERLGSGFSAEVWSAEVANPPIGVDVKAGQSVAIKFFHAHAMAIPDQVIRIEREFRIAQQVRHPNLIRIYEFVLASSRPHHNFLVMDVAKGQTLKSQIPPTGLSVQKTLQVMLQLLSALDELHSAGALHRDIKPANISVDDASTGIHATLLDLGIVSVQQDSNLTAVTKFLGSKHWAPYEQLLGESLDARSDLYSLGSVAYHMLTGDLPYNGRGTEAAIAVEMARRPLRLPDTVSLDPTIREMINSCLSTEPKSRPASAKDCKDLIQAFLGRSN